jgi:quinol-cytochrome oxidoreductase complex cytochrome b subunit
MATPRRTRATEVGDWIDERSGWRLTWSTIFIRRIPKVNWAYTLGSATLFVLILQVVTGVLLMFYYVPEPTQAYASVEYITYELTMGWLIRGLHHFGSSAMVILTIAHMLRVILYGAYKYPREVTWITGVALLLLVFSFGFTGYLLPWDQRAYWATVVGTQIAEVTPFIGGWLKSVMLGGEQISALTLPRFYAAHVWALPAALLTLVGVHLYLVIRNGITSIPRRDEQ